MRAIFSSLLAFLRQLFNTGKASAPQEQEQEKVIAPPIFTETKESIKPIIEHTTASVQKVLIVNNQPYTFAAPTTRDVSRVFIHCTASSNPKYDLASVKRDHTNLGYKRDDGVLDVAYHFFITFAGELQLGRKLWSNPDAQKGHNTGTIAICLQGLVVKDFTSAQMETLTALCQQINEAYGGSVTFHGHNEVSNRGCPVFDYRAALKLDSKGNLGV